MKKLIYLLTMSNEMNHTDEIIRETLKTPAYSLPDDFADKITLKVEKRMAWDQYMREFIIYLGAFIGIIATPVTILFFFNKESWERLANRFLDYPSVFIGIFVILLFILFTDRFLLRYFLKVKKIQ